MSEITEFATLASASAFTIRLRSIFITAPQNDSEPITILEGLKGIFSKYKIKYVAVVREKHLDGEYHLHAMVRVTDQPKVSSKKVDEIFGKHVNIQKVKSESQALKYLKKEGDPEFFTTEDVTLDDLINKKVGEKKFERIAKRIRDEADFDLLEEEPGFLLQHGKKIQDFKKVVKEEQMKNVVIPKYPVKTSILKDWQLNSLKVLFQQNERQILWVVDPEGGTGKTWLANYLVNNYSAFYWRSSKKQDIAYSYNFEPIVCFDFVRTNEDTVSYEMIEQFKDGMIISTKYESLIKKRKDIKVIVFSNFEPKVDALSHDRWVIQRLRNLYDYKDERLALEDLYASESDDSDLELPEIYQ